MITSSALLAGDRQARIRAQIADRGSVRSAELAAELGVSIVTIRRDLADLRKAGEVELVYGGARSAGGRVPPPDRRERTGVEVEAKAAIARAAAGLLKAGDTVYLDSGTTCAAMVPYLAAVDGLTVVTNDLTTAVELTGAAPEVSVIMAPGVIDPATLSTVGELLPPVLANFVFDVVFVSASAWQPGVGATTGDLSYAAVKRAVIERAKASYLLVDASKFGVAEPHVVQRLQDFDAVVTDESLSAEHRRELDQCGVELVAASA
ncbi:DeoR/GlpR family DNA-binding transcription regulator [Herbiconiux flava]|uniref:DeoR family fructose operon transcriptional repressor n=1 Tax=Herbiconiux flava TaxID=881268 RepID=A0A852SJ35_9MICO|nr:DeoR/GlpR family DNA-binding transcription regulator [Herbiconiux flava]NYD69874.1 DeoR family fructose operon transcriptional repressor [Herbiconiux flava]GLK16623.1 DeoR family transcriptional regulator [Herbiconiux flava]